MSYTDDTVSKIRQAMAIIGPSYKIPVHLTLLYSKNDISSLESSGTITGTFSMQDLAERYFSGIIGDISYELSGGVDGVSFFVHSAIDASADSSTVLISVDVYGVAGLKATDMAIEAKSKAYNYTQQQYLNDMALRSSRRWADR